MSENARKTSTHTLNGIDIDRVTSLAGKIKEDENYGKFQFRAKNRWIKGAKSKTSIQGFFAGGQERTSRTQALSVEADQPVFLAGGDSAPNSVEHLLHSLTSCLTTTLAYHASVQGIVIGSIETSATGNLDSRGFFGLSDEVSKGYESIKVKMRVASSASVKTLTALAMNSPVYEMVSRSVPVEFILETYQEPERLSNWIR
jgi:uncharacterized OsmC-like protein